MLGGADMKKLFSLKMLDGASIKKALFSQYVRRGLAQKNLFLLKMRLLQKKLHKFRQEIALFT